MLHLKQTIALIFSLSLFGPVLLPIPVSAQSSAPMHWIVKYRDGSTSQQLSQSWQNHHAQVLQTYSALRTTTLSMPVEDVDALQHDKRVEYVEHDSRAQAVALPDDPNFNLQWGLNNTGQVIKNVTGTSDADIDAPEAWAKSTGTGVTVAVLDSGIDTTHPDLLGKVTTSINFSNSATTEDKFGHGTHVAGIIAATSNNKTGVAGTCPDCRLINVKVLGDDGSGTYSSMISGLTWAADHGAKVINLSLGGSYGSRALEDAVNYAWNKGVVVVAAAGNDGMPFRLYPAAYTRAIAVAATDSKDHRASFSNWSSSWVDIAAPGLSIYSTTPVAPSYLSTHGYKMSYDYLSGTSMAAPFVAGVAALVWSSSFGTSATAVRSRLETKADPISGTGYYWSAGRVNAARAVTP
jgi:thermitase